MSSRSLEVLAATLLALAAFACHAAPLRVCGDPDNLPYSHADGSGFENRIAKLVADDLRRPLAMTWMPFSRGLVRKTLVANVCDVLIGVPNRLEDVLVTRPYYRSSYVFVTRAADASPLRTFDDARLPRLRIGVQLIGNDMATTPPGHALAARGAVDRVVGFTVLGEGPAPQRMVAALAKGDLDAALIWGPQAGWFARHSPVPLSLARAHAPPEVHMPFKFSIAMAVRPGDGPLRDALNDVIDRRRADIDAILAEYGVPRTDRIGGM
jgi:mxaJ protein